MSDETPISETTDEGYKPRKWHEKLSPQGREALAQGFNPRSLSDDDYAEWEKHNRKATGGEDLVHPDDEDDE